MQKLICLSGMNKGEAFELLDGESYIGRSDKNSICVFDRKVSRVHCKLVVSADSVTIEDMGSTNGSKINNIYVNGIEEIKTGDHIRTGQTVFLLSDKPLSETEEASIPAKEEGMEPDEPVENASFHLTKTSAFRKMKTEKSGGSVGFLSFLEKEDR